MNERKRGARFEFGAQVIEKALGIWMRGQLLLNGSSVRVYPFSQKATCTEKRKKTGGRRGSKERSAARMKRKEMRRERRRRGRRREKRDMRGDKRVKKRNEIRI